MSELGDVESGQRELEAVVALTTVTSPRGPGELRPDVFTDNVRGSSVEEHIAAVAESPHLKGPGKLLLLGELKGHGYEADQLQPLALSLIRPELPDADRQTAASALLERVGESGHGGDPLGRAPSDLSLDDDLPTADADAGALFSTLIKSVSGTMLGHLPKCQARRVSAGGQPALYVQTESWSKEPLHKFAKVIDPREWPNCPAQKPFFKRMDPLAGAISPPPPLNPPDKGWTQILQEEVDFGLGVIHNPALLMTTQLNVMYNELPHSIGSTYQLHHSVDGKIVFDQGYLLAQDLEARGLRHITTLKAVWFANDDRNTPASAICPVWSLSSALITFACLDH